MASNYDKHIFRQLEEVLKKCDSLSQEIKDLKEQHKQEIYKLKEEHKKEVDKLNSRIKFLEKENAELKAENDLLKGKMIQKNSNNSNIPPSMSNHKIQNHREKSDKKQGGQIGRKGKTLSAKDIENLIKSDSVDVIEEHYGNKNNSKTTIKYILDIKTKVIVRKIFIHGESNNIEIPEECKNKSSVIYGTNIKSLAAVMYAQEVIAFDRMSNFIEILTDNILKVSHGSLVNWIHDISIKSKKIKKKLAKAVRKGNLIYTDATVTSLNGKNAYARNYSTDTITIFEASRSKRIQEIQRQNILPNFKGYIMHDHETGLYNFGIKSNHLECWIHLGRELKYFDENIKNSWSKELWDFAWNINKKRKELLKESITEFKSEELIEYEKKYDEIVRKGIGQNKLVKSKYLKGKEKAVLTRLERYKVNYLNYLKNFELPFDDNLSERDLRATKIKKKVSGCHRSFEGLKDYSNIRSIIGTCIKQEKNYFELFKNLLLNKPISISKIGLIMMP